MTLSTTPEQNDDNPEVVIRGQLERVTFNNEKTGYSVLRINVKGFADVVTAVGCCPAHLPGEELELSGEWVVHQKFGRQFQFVSCKSILPSTVEGIRRYLGSGLIKGIGPRMAERIVDEFGERTLDVLDESPDDLLNVRGISSKLLDSVKISWNAQKEFRDVMLFLQSGGIGPGFAAKIFAAYGHNTIQVVKENPYKLADDIFGIGFRTADQFASGIGIDKSSPMRHDAGVLYALTEMSGDGHVFAPRNVLAARAAKLLGTQESPADEAILRVAAEAAVIMERLRGHDGEVFDAVYLPPYNIAEYMSARRLSELSSRSARLEIDGCGIDTERASAWIQDCMKIRLADNQMLALKMAMESECMVITGGPGTGKTTLIRAIIGIWGARKLRILLAAPTGRAAKRMSEATGHEAKTIHRMLEFDGGQNCFQRNKGNPLECDLLIVDEASMIDITLMYHLLAAVPKNSRLILVGDVCQLPSVGPGNVLKDIIASGAMPVARLNEIFRQAEESDIIVNAHRVNSGKLPETHGGDDLRDFYFVERDEPERCVEMMLSLVCDRIPARFGLDPMSDIQVLSPMNKGTLGTMNLNTVLQKALNRGRGAMIERSGRAFKVGDKVMQKRNDYDKDVYNGDIGFIVTVDRDAGLLTVNMDGREIIYESTEFDDLMHAYAISIHKSQGSEYPAVVIPLHTQHYIMLRRNLLYTAITRGRKLVVVIGTKKALSIAVKNDDTGQRYTYLAERLM